MLRKSVRAVVGLLVVVGLVAAQQGKDAKGGKEVTCKVTKVDANKMVVSVTTEDGKKMELKVGDDTKICRSPWRCQQGAAHG